MDPVTILGTAGAVLSIIDVLSRTLKSLLDLHNSWKDADHTIVNLMSQLIALRAALKKISEWISSDLAHAPQHHQLVMDLEDSVACCRMLIQTMDDQLSKLDSTHNDRLDIGSKIRIMLEAKTSQDFQTFIGRQTSALTLLLTACNWFASISYASDRRGCSDDILVRRMLNKKCCWRTPQAVRSSTK